MAISEVYCPTSFEDAVIKRLSVDIPYRNTIKSVYDEFFMREQARLLAEVLYALYSGDGETAMRDIRSTLLMNPTAVDTNINPSDVLKWIAPVIAKNFSDGKSEFLLNELERIHYTHTP